MGAERDFTFYRILCCTPPDLEPERLVFEAAVGQFNEDVGMSDGCLFAAASLRPPADAVRQQRNIEANIRMCEFYVGIFGDVRPDPVFEGFLDYALSPAAEMKGVALLFREWRPQITDDRCEIKQFSDAADLARQLREILAAWYAAQASVRSSSSLA
jgi:hypothetical protein